MKLSLVSLLAPLTALAVPTTDAGLDARQAPISIDALMKAKGKLYYGTATDRNRLTAGSNAAIIAANFGQVTPENSMKWESLNRRQGGYNTADGDYLASTPTHIIPRCPREERETRD